MQSLEKTTLGLPAGRFSRIILVGLSILFVIQLVTLVRLLLFVEDLLDYGDYMIDSFGHTSVGNIFWSFIPVVLLLSFSGIRHKYRFVVAACVVFWLRTAVGAGTWRYFTNTIDNIGLNLHVFNDMPWRLAVMASSSLACLTTLLFIIGILTGESAESLLNDWTGYFLRLSGKKS